MASEIATAIVNYNTREHLRACLHSALQDGAREILVIDNASSDGSASLIRDEYPGIPLIENTVNRGFGAAANQAIATCRAPYLLLLNSDTRLRPGTLSANADYLDRNPRAAIVGPRLVNVDGSLQRSCRRFPGSAAWLIDNFVSAPLLARLPVARRHALHTWPHDEARVVPWVLGAALALRRDTVRHAGGFDEGFFLYYEEIDLCSRLRDLGWEVHFNPDASIVHVGGASGRNRATEQHRNASARRFYRQHYGPLRGAILRLLLRAKDGTTHAA